MDGQLWEVENFQPLVDRKGRSKLIVPIDLFPMREVRESGQIEEADLKTRSLQGGELHLEGGSHGGRRVEKIL